MSKKTVLNLILRFKVQRVLTKSNDLYLYQTVTKSARPKYEDNNHSTSSYHKTTSSTHRSSSGRTHGGGGGKF